MKEGKYGEKMTDITESEWWDRLVELFFLRENPDEIIDRKAFDIEFESYRQQILQNQKDAQKFDYMQSEASRNFDIDDVIWKDGEYNFKEWFAQLGKLQSQHKKLVDAIQNIVDSQSHNIDAGYYKDSDRDWWNMFIGKLQNLLKESEKE